MAERPSGADMWIASPTRLLRVALFTLLVTALLSCGYANVHQRSSRQPGVSNTGPQRPGRVCEISNRPGTYAAKVVDARAHAALAAALRTLSGIQDVGGLTSALEAFYADHGDDYDFIYLMVPDENFQVRGLHVNVRSRFAPEIGLVHPGLPALAARWPRLRSVLVMAQPPTARTGPMIHELVHYWGQALGSAPALGFPANSHWGMTGVNGQLGGFDPKSLHCKEPNEAVPPHCKREANGRFEVGVRPFGDHANGGDALPVAPLELWLMGLIPDEQVPPIPQLVDAKLLGSGLQSLYSVSDVRWVTIADVVAAMHGHPKPAPEADKALRVAFVLIDKVEPQPSMFEAVAIRARGFAAVQMVGWYSWCAATGGRSTVRADL